MFWVFTLVGGGLVWNSLDSIAGFFVATDGMADAFALVCGLALVEIAGAGLVAGTKQLGPQAHALVHKRTTRELESAKSAASWKFVWLVFVPLVYPGILAVAFRAAHSSVLHTPDGLLTASYVIVPVTAAYVLIRLVIELRRKRTIDSLSAQVARLRQ